MKHLRFVRSIRHAQALAAAFLREPQKPHWEDQHVQG